MPCAERKTYAQRARASPQGVRDKCKQAREHFGKKGARLRALPSRNATIKGMISLVYSNSSQRARATSSIYHTQSTGRATQCRRNPRSVSRFKVPKDGCFCFWPTNFAVLLFSSGVRGCKQEKKIIFFFYQNSERLKKECRQDPEKNSVREVVNIVLSQQYDHA